MKHLLLMTGAAFAAILSTAAAAPVLASSDYAASIYISADGLVKVSTVLGAASGAAPPAYDDFGNLAGINQRTVLVSGIVAGVETLTAGTVTSEAFRRYHPPQWVTSVSSTPISD